MSERPYRHLIVRSKNSDISDCYALWANGLIDWDKMLRTTHRRFVALFIALEKCKELKNWVTKYLVIEDFDSFSEAEKITAIIEISKCFESNSKITGLFRETSLRSEPPEYRFSQR